MDKNIDPDLVLKPVKATTSFFDAFTSLFNLLMISILVLFIVINIIGIVTSEANMVMFIFTILAALFLALYVLAILTRSLELNENGIEYREAWRKVSLGWDDIEAIRVEKALGQITFWVNEKKVRIHTYGLNRKEQKEVHKALEEQMKARLIPNR